MVPAIKYPNTLLLSWLPLLLYLLKSGTLDVDLPDAVNGDLYASSCAVAVLLYRAARVAVGMLVLGASERRALEDAARKHCIVYFLLVCMCDGRAAVAMRLRGVYTEGVGREVDDDGREFEVLWLGCSKLAAAPASRVFASAAVGRNVTNARWPDR